LCLLMFYAPGLRNFHKFFKHGVVFPRLWLLSKSNALPSKSATVRLSCAGRFCAYVCVVSIRVWPSMARTASRS
jgi:hypothetical protein